MKVFGKIFALFVLGSVLQPAFAKVTVFACEPEWANLTQELAGDRAEVFAATTALQDVHHIEARPSLIAKLRRADLMVCTGADLEAGWLPTLLRQAGNNKVQSGQNGYFEAAMQVERLEIPQSVDRAQGDVHAAGSPHIQMDPHRVLTIAKALADRLSAIDAGNAALYGDRLKQFEARWTEAMVRWEQQAAPLKGVPVVTHHKDWTYLTAWLGLQEVGTLEPNPGVPPSAGHLADLKARLKDRPARLIMRAAYQDERASQWLSEQTGIPAVMLPYTVGGSPAAKDLFSLFDDTVARLVGALK